MRSSLLIRILLIERLFNCSAYVTNLIAIRKTQCIIVGTIISIQNNSFDFSLAIFFVHKSDYSNKSNMNIFDSLHCNSKGMWDGWVLRIDKSTDQIVFYHRHRLMKLFFLLVYLQSKCKSKPSCFANWNRTQNDVMLFYWILDHPSPYVTFEFDSLLTLI